jgi:general secretion pathway protein E/type IV pilus assembly protein PilB
MNRLEKATISEYRPLPEESDQYPLEYIENNSVIKLRESAQAVQIGVCEVTNLRIQEDLRHFHQKSTVFYEIDKSELAAYLGEKLSDAGLSGTAGPALKEEELLLDKLAKNAPIINLINSLLIEAIRQEASDIHIEGFSDEVVVRYRIDGSLHAVNRLDKEKFAAISTRVKIMANLNIMERRLPQDGRITVHLLDDAVDIRVSIVPIAKGESIVLRLFNKKKSPLTLEQLGLSKQYLSALRSICRLPSGLVLVTGPTGSGKTTTLNAVLQEINTEEEKIVTIEDPIEYVIEGVDQIQINEKIGLTFDSILRRTLRQDPNIIMVGEARDTQTAQLCIRAALTGHLVFTTLHTRDSISAIPRLVNVGIEPYLIAAVMNASMAQRLVRVICGRCMEKVRPSGSERELLRRYELPDGPVYIGRGCGGCRNTGYRGRTGLFELFAADERLEEMIVCGTREAELKSYLESRGMSSIIADGLKKALKGITTISEVERFVDR